MVGTAHHETSARDDGLGTRSAPCFALGSSDERFGDRTGVLLDLVTLLRPGPVHGVDDVQEARHVPAWLGWEIGTDVERAAVGRTDRVQGPATLTVQLERGVHVDLVDVGAFLSVDLDADEGLVHSRGDLRILEGLALHHVAPVAGAVADRDEQRLVFGPRAIEGLVAPGIPVDRIVLVLT